MLVLVMQLSMPWFNIAPVSTDTGSDGIKIKEVEGCVGS